MEYGSPGGSVGEKDDLFHCLQHLYREEEMSSYALTHRRHFPLERLTTREDGSFWSPAKCIYQSKMIQLGATLLLYQLCAKLRVSWLAGHSFIPHLQILVSEHLCLELLHGGRCMRSG